MEAAKQKSPKINISSILYYLVVSLVVVLLLNTISIRSDKAYSIIRFRTYTVLSGSMEPVYNPGDLVITTKTNPEKLQPQDIITFTNDNEIITHRIIDKTPEGFITKGDNNNVQDTDIVTADNVIGKVAFSIPKAGYVVQFLSQKWVVALEMILLGIFIFIYNKDE